MADSDNIEFQLGLLPERKMDWRTLVTSYGFEILLLLFLVNVGLIWPDRMELAQKYHVTELIPIPSLRAPKPPQFKPVRAKLLPPTPRLEVARVETPKLTVPREVRVVHQRPVEVAAPKVIVNTFSAPRLVQTSGGARLARLVRTGEFGSSAAPTVNMPIQKVQTGGFGDPNGVKGEGKDNAHLQIAKVGSFELPQGPGQGNGAGGAKGVKGTVASAGFGNGIAQPGVGDGRSNGRGSVNTGGFAGTQIAQNTGGKGLRSMESGPATNPVEILYKPTPVYTQEARNLKLEGEVLIEVMFGANGQLQVNHVVRGLGHGLDEAGIAAANQIRFKPAMRNGTPIDSTAVVHVSFQLAY
jgi:TonB family protein